MALKIHFFKTAIETITQLDTPIDNIIDIELLENIEGIPFEPISSTSNSQMFLQRITD